MIRCATTCRRWLTAILLLIGFFLFPLSPFAEAQNLAQNPAQNSAPAETSRQNQDSTLPTLKSQTTLVEVPTVVTDRHGRHIHGLNKNDFRVFENGKEEKIAVFEEVVATNQRPPVPDRSANAFSNLSAKTEGRHALTVVLLDQINTPFLDQYYGRQQLIKYLAANLDPRQTLGLMILGRNGVQKVTDFTQDPASVIATLKKLGGETPAMQGLSIDAQALAATRSDEELATFALQRNGMPSNPEARMQRFALGSDALEARYGQERSIEETMRAFLSIAWSLSGIPGRKSLVWATGSFPFFMDSPSATPNNPRLSVLYERAMQALNDAQVSVYPIDVRGLVMNSHVGDPTAMGSRNQALQAATGAFTRSDYLVSTIQNLKTFAEMTGGRAFYNSNDLTIGYKQAAEDSSSYYVLGYYLNSGSTKTGWRKLKVKLDNVHADVRAREGFFVGSTLDAESAHKADVNFALISPFESTGIPMLVRWNGAGAPATEPGKKAEFAIIVPANSVVSEADQDQFDIDFVWEADRNGAPPERDGRTTRGKLDAETLAKVKKEGVFYTNSLQLAPGQYKVHFVVRNNLNGRIGSVTTPLTVN
jgi:VWFA-related protein